MNRRAIIDQARERLTPIATGAGLGAVGGGLLAIADPVGLVVAGALAGGYASTRPHLGALLGRARSSLAAQRTLAPVKAARGHVTSYRDRSEIQDRWPVLVAGFTPKDSDPPELLDVTVSPDVITLRVRLLAGQDRAKGRELADSLRRALRGTLVEVDDLPPRSITDPLEIAVRITRTGLPEQVILSEIPDVAEHGAIYFGIDEAGRPVYWVRDDRFHLAIGGETRAGKSSLLGLIAWTCARAGELVVLLDSKGGTSEFHRLDLLPMVQRATTGQEQARVLEEMEAERAARMRLVNEHGSLAAAAIALGVPAFSRIVVVVDELARFNSHGTSRAWDRLVSFVELGAEAQISVVFANPRLDVERMGPGASSLRDQGGGISLGRTRPEIAKMPLGVAPDRETIDRLPDRKGAALTVGLSYGDTEVRVVQLAYLAMDARVPAGVQDAPPLNLAGPHSPAPPTVTVGQGQRDTRSLVAAILEDSPDGVTLDALAARTGRKHRTVRSALEQLATEGAAREHGGVWRAA